MKTHTELLSELIAVLYAAPITVETHPLKMLAAEIKGQMMAQLPPMMTLDAEASKVTPTPDAGVWIENTGVMPECDISAIRYFDGEIWHGCDKERGWHVKRANNKSFVITHYRPA